MELTLVLDHPFVRASDGRVYSPKNYHYGLFAANYLQVLESVRILGRVSDQPGAGNPAGPAEGERVEIISLADWHGLGAAVRNRWHLLRRLRDHLSRDSAVILIAPGVVPTLAQDLLSRAGSPYGIEVIGDPHDVFAPGAFHHPLRAFLRWWMTGRLRHQCRGACAVRYVSGEVLPRRYPASPEAFTTCCSSIELLPEAFVARPRPPSRSDGRRVIVTVGSLSQAYKGQDVLIDAVAACVADGLDLELVLVGDGRLRPVLEARAGERALGARVVFTGQLPFGDAVRAQLDRGDLFVLPSRADAMPRAVMEAMARALPCVGTTIGGLTELLPAEDLVPPGDSEALARKMGEVLRSPERLARMSARNLGRAAEYRADVLRERRFAFYEHVRRRTEEWLSREGR